MKTKTLNVLSIDFDFFQTVEETVIKEHYPDGVDLPTELTIFTWGSHYANKNCEQLIRNVGINETKLKELLDILSNNKAKEPKVLITNSHRHIYDFILENYSKSTKLNLVNIDMHHDMFNDNPKLDCGNWVKHITNAITNYSLTWIANPISLSAYKLDENEFDMVRYDFENIKDMDFDLIFLCRSDTWTPPHLDEYFHNIVKHIAAIYDNVLIENQVSKPRDFEDDVTQLKKTYKEMEKSSYEREHY